MPCQPLNSSDFLLDSSGPNLGLGSVSLPDLNIPFPALPLQNLQELFDSLSMILPPGIQKPTFHPDVLNDIYAGIKALLDQFAPFLALYKFFLPVLNLILCIIEVLCAIPNPFKLIRALRKLFRDCIPEFLALFPYFALILMIIALLLLILALIEYIIQRIIEIIETILKNILILTKAAQSLNNDSIIAIVRKIGDLLCLLQNLFILFALFNTIIQIIKAISSLFFRIPPCDSSDGSDDGCCTPDVCPEFIRENEMFSYNTGTFTYTNAVGIDSGLALPAGFAPFFSYIRDESWQFYDSSLTQNQDFINITSAFDLPAGNTTVFFPPGIIYDSSTNYTQAPYYVDFQVLYNPVIFGHFSDPLGTRNILIKKALVKAPPIAGVKNYENNLVSPTNGTLNLVGGTITEMDGTPLADGIGNPLTINTFFHQDLRNGSVLNPSDPVVFTNVSYTFYINHPVLLNYNLITIGCVPSVARERDFLSATIGDRFNGNGAAIAAIIPILPDPGAAQACVAAAIIKYRKQVSTETTNIFQSEIMDCLNKLRKDTVAALVATVGAGVDPYASTFTLEPSIQFTTGTVKVIVSLNEHSGNSVSTGLPADAAMQLAIQLSALTSFGEITNFEYDGSQFFTADITSETAGNGVVQVSFANNFIGIITVPADLNTPQSIAITSESFTFVKAQSIGDGAVLRDEGDVSRE